MKSPARFLSFFNLQKYLNIFIIFGLFFIFLFLITTPVTHATGVSNNSNYSDTAEPENNNTGINSDVPKNMHSFAQIILIETMSAMVCQLAGYDPSSPNHKCLGVDPKTGNIGFVENGGGAIAIVAGLIDSTLTPPISSTHYIAYMKNNFGLVKDANAQTNPCARANRGVGFCGLLPILDLWVAMRNIVYLILILVFIVIGVGVMLRIHIDPRTVMTIQNQIPKIIIGLLAITFSFAIAGFLIDVMWVATYLFAGVITNVTASANQTKMDSIIQAGTPFIAANEVYSGGVISLASGTSAAFADIVTSAINGLSLGLIQDLIGGIVNVIAFLIIFIAIIVALLRLWVTLVITYINVILDVVFAPFWILAGVLPGSSAGIGAWFKDMLANLAVFPVAISFFLLGSFFVSTFGENINTNRVTPPLLGGTNSEAVAAIIGLGFILMLPNVLNTTKEFFKAPKVNFGPIFGPVGVGAGIVGGVPKRISSGVINEATRMKYEHGQPKEPTGLRKWVRTVKEAK